VKLVEGPSLCAALISARTRVQAFHEPSSPDRAKVPAGAQSVTEADVARGAILKPLLPSGAGPVWGSGDTWGDEEMLPPAAVPAQRTMARSTGNDSWGAGATLPRRDRRPPPPRQRQTAETRADDSRVPLFNQPIRTIKVETPLLDRPLQDAGGRFGRGGGGDRARGTRAGRDQRKPYSSHGYERPTKGRLHGAEMREEFPREPPRREAACSEFWGAPAGSEMPVSPRRYASQSFDSTDAQYDWAHTLSALRTLSTAAPTPQHRSDRTWSPPRPAAARPGVRGAQPRSPSPQPPARPARRSQQWQREPLERERSHAYRDEAAPFARPSVRSAQPRSPSPPSPARLSQQRQREPKVAYRGVAAPSPAERGASGGTDGGRNQWQARQPEHVEVPSEHW
jgi:hypothetical protein